MMADGDPDGSGEIEFEEFVVVLEDKLKVSTNRGLGQLSVAWGSVPAAVNAKRGCVHSVSDERNVRGVGRGIVSVRETF